VGTHLVNRLYTVHVDAHFLQVMNEPGAIFTDRANEAHAAARACDGSSLVRTLPTSSALKSGGGYCLSGENDVFDCEQASDGLYAQR
jgi:hypothetical protein